MPALCSVLGTGDDEPVSIEVLKALYTIIAPDGSGEIIDICSALDWLIKYLEASSHPPKLTGPLLRCVTLSWVS